MEALSLIHIATVIGGLFIGAAAATLVLQSRIRHQKMMTDDAHQQLAINEAQFNTVKNELDEYRERLFHNQSQLGELGQKAAQLTQLQREHGQLLVQLREQQQAYADLNAKFESQAAQFSEAKRASDEKLALMEEAEKRLQTQFENLANKIFEQKSESFSKLNKSGIDALLTPLKQQIEGFQKQIGDQYIREGQERASLKTEILSLKELNQKITEEASALTQALKGDNKQQGNWGEVVLERILKESGLREGHEFETQVSVRNIEGKLQQPDVVVHLPNDKDVIIDSKVSLRAYEQFFNTTESSERARYLNEHVASLRNHIKGLGEKSYHELKSIRSLDYVLLFIPVEPAFLLAVQEDPSLVTMALNHNIMLVSPTNLLVALRTINNIWQYEYQNQNAQLIADHASKLYDKFAGFVNDLEKVGRGLESTQKHYEGALGKLSEGKGNLVRQVENFRQLGVQPSKKIPDSLLKRSKDD